MESKSKTKNESKHASNKVLLGAIIATSIIFVVQCIFLIINGVNAINANIGLNNYRELQERQISKVIEMCNTSIANGISYNDDVIRKVFMYFASGSGDNAPAKINQQYLKDISLSYCRAAEFALYGVEDIDQRPFSTSDFLYGMDESPRRVTSESFDHIRW